MAGESVFHRVIRTLRSALSPSAWKDFFCWDYVVVDELPDLKLECSACGYVSQGFFPLLNAAVYRCRECEDIVNPRVRPLLFLPPDCPCCGNPLLKEDLIRTGEMGAGDSTICPKCGEKRLHIQDVIDIDIYETGDCIPQRHDVIHAYVFPKQKGSASPSSLLVPRLVDDLEIRISNGSLDEMEKGYHKFRVCDIDPERSVLTLEWLGRLPAEEDWPDYYGFERTHQYNWGKL